MPLRFAEEGVDALILKYLHREAPEADLSEWKDLVDRCYHPKDEVSIAIVGKYVEYEDSYKSLKEALTHGAVAQNLKLNITWIEAEGSGIKDSRRPQLRIAARRLRRHPRSRRLRQARHRGHVERHPLRARENRCRTSASASACRPRASSLRATSAASKTPTPASSTPPRQHRIIYKLRELLGVEEMGGTMRLGAWTCILQDDSLAATAYGGATEISERHRHRYEFNREYEALLTGGGLRISGTTPDATYVEIVEIPGHPYFLGCQFHPEFKSRPLEPHPLFREFVRRATKTG